MNLPYIKRLVYSQQIGLLMQHHTDILDSKIKIIRMQEKKKQHDKAQLVSYLGKIRNLTYKLNSNTKQIAYVSSS